MNRAPSILAALSVLMASAPVMADEMTDRLSCRPNGYSRPFGGAAAWNIEATSLPTHVDNDKLVDFLWNETTADRPGNFNLTFDTYTYPVYYATCATDEYQVRTEWDSNIDGKMIPWNTDWQPASGSDGQVIILDEETGREWNLWQVEFDGRTINATNGSVAPGSYHTAVGGHPPSRGIGIQYLAMLVQPEAVRSGRIPHALSMPAKRTDGTVAFPPATKIEHPGRPKGMPIGARFALVVTDAEIDAWLGALPPNLPSATRESARVIAEALRTYGWFITDTSGGSHFQFEDRLTAGAQWDELGLGEFEADGKVYPRDLLDGLLTPTRIRAIVPSDVYPSR